jgi:hypothetical protein
MMMFANEMSEEEIRKIIQKIRQLDTDIVEGFKDVDSARTQERNEALKCREDLVRHLCSHLPKDHEENIKIQTVVKGGSLMREVNIAVFGHAEFRAVQEEVVMHTFCNNDSFVLMPTGGGKSLCYQLPAICNSGLTVVVSPLIALMQDQLLHIRSLGIRAGLLSGSQLNEERDAILRDLNGPLLVSLRSRTAFMSQFVPT